MRQSSESATTTSPSDEETEEQRKAREAREAMAAKIAELQKEFNATKRRLILSQKEQYDDLTNPDIYSLHANLLITCANTLLKPQGRKFVVDDNNRQVLRFLLYYFNNCDLAQEVFADRQYDLRKNILLCGAVGVGKTLLMDAFSLYLKESNNPRFFYNISQTQMLNSYKLTNNLDKFIYNEQGSKEFSGHPHNLCVNDLGLQTQKFYGQDTKVIIDEFLFARYELWATKGKFVHLTTNLDKEDIAQLFFDEHGRLADRFKMFNVVPLGGTSRR